MKKVRFNAVEKVQTFAMNDSECHSPRPFVGRVLETSPPSPSQGYHQLLCYQTDAIQRFENSNSSPYPSLSRTQIPSFIARESIAKPCDDLDLSILDDSNMEPRKPAFCKSILKETNEKNLDGMNMFVNNMYQVKRPPVLSSVENNAENPPNILVKDNSFFIRRENLEKYNINVNPLQTQLNRLSLDKENNPFTRKAEMMITRSDSHPEMSTVAQPPNKMSPDMASNCKCCWKRHMGSPNQVLVTNKTRSANFHDIRDQMPHSCARYTPTIQFCCGNNSPPAMQQKCKPCNCHSNEISKPPNTIEQKILAIEKYEKSKQSDCMEVEKQANVSKEKREPTVADLFKIIKLQNEQLQLLQEKVDKFISTSQQNHTPNSSTQTTEHVAINAVETHKHKMSVGVMTSFEMIRTSTVINKEVLKHTNDTSQIHCNQSHVSIKEIVSSPVNFLEGISPKNVSEVGNNCVLDVQQTGGNCEEKTLNELSLYNIQVDNATTPLMSPDQTMYLDVRDYSDSEASNNDQSNVGWTYYNKVMTHVNGMLQDSEMPSSASAMYRNMRQQCLQMQIDKTNVSVTKRVKFGDDPYRLRQPHIYAPATETSLKMNQLAAKYLNKMPIQPPPRPLHQANAHVDMSLATRNYMEKHRLLQGLPGTSKSPQVGEIPRFLDITALKQQQQQKFL